MSEKNTLARPYAKAIFQLAKEKNKYQEWVMFFNVLINIVSNQKVLNLIKNPMIAASEKAQFIIEVGEKSFNEREKELVRMLAKNHRLLIVSAIRTLYEQYRAEEEQTLEVEVCSAVVLQEEQQQELTKVFRKYFNKKIKAQWTQDKELIGGFIVKAHDKVFDGSIRGQLKRLHREIVSNG